MPTYEAVLAALMTFLIIMAVAVALYLVAVIVQMYFPNVAERLNATYHALMGTDPESDAEYNSYTTPPARLR